MSRVSSLAAFVAGLVLLWTLAWSGAARAQVSPADRAKASELKRQGDEAMDALKPEDAVKAYSAAFAITQDPALYYNKARAYQVMGRFPEALTEFEAFQQKAPADLKARVPILPQLIAEVRAKTTTLTLRSSQPGARVLVGDKIVGAIGEDGSFRAVVNAGHGKLEIAKEGFVPFQREVDFPPAGSVAFDATLVPADKAGILAVSVKPRVGMVFVDGRLAGGPPVEVAVDAGTHRIRVTADGYSDAETSAVVEAKGRREVEVPLEKSAPLTQKWWFWTGIGVVVVGGVVLTYALLTEREPGSGDIPPGRVSGPLVRF